MVKSFSFAFQGVFDALLYERNFRVQWLAGLMVFLFNSLFVLLEWQHTVLMILVFLVLALELMNCAIEKACDSFGIGFDAHKKRAKDFAAASVLVFCTGAAVVFVGIISLKAANHFEFIERHPWEVVAFLLVFFGNLPAVLSAKPSVNTMPFMVIGVGADGYLLTNIFSQPLFCALAALFHGLMLAAFIRRHRLASKALMP